MIWNIKLKFILNSLYLRLFSSRGELYEDLKKLFEYAPCGVLAIDSNANILSANKKLEVMFGYSAAEIIGEKIERLVPSAYSAAYLKLKNDYIANPAPRIMGQGPLLYGRHKSGAEFPIDFGLTPVKWKGDRIIFALITDISKIKSEAIVLADKLNFASAASGVGIWEWVIDTNTLIWNETMYKLYGISADAFSGEYEAWSNSVHPEDLQDAVVKLQVAIKDEKNFETTFRIICPDKKIKHLKAFGSVKRESDGKPISMIGVNIDITEEIINKNKIADYAAKLEETNHFLDSIFENIPSMVFIKEAKELKFTNLNKAGEQILGYPRGDLIGKNDYDFFPKELADAYVTKDRETLKTTSVTDIPEERVQARDLSFRWLHTKKVMIPDSEGRPAYLLGVSEDITEDKRVKEELAKLNRELETSNHDLDQFAYIASHDLKAPLRAINNYATWIIEDSSETLSQDSKEHLAKLIRRTQRMQELLESLLAYSRIGKEGGEIVRTNTSDLVAKVVDLVSPPRGTQITIQADMPIIQTAHAPIEMVFRNLIDNALKHNNSKNRKISISGKVEGQYCLFEIKDNGEGIPLEFHEKIFGMFQALKPESEGGGAGMGLALVKKVVENIGGKIKIESTPGQGSIFRFTWPLVCK